VNLISARWVLRRLVLLAAACLLVCGAAATVAQPATPVGDKPAPGAAGIGDAYYPLLGNGGYDVRHYTLTLDLDVAAGRIRDATATLDAVATQHLSAFNLDYRGPVIDAITVDGRPASWNRDGGELTITPTTPIASGAAFQTTVRYHGTPTVDSADRFERGWWTSGDSIFTVGEPAGADRWYPVNGHPRDKATYTLIVTVPEPYTVVANGALVAETELPGSGGGPPRRTFTWENDDPTASYLVLIHAAELDIQKETGPGGITLIEAFPPDFSNQEARYFAQVPEMIATFEEYFGPYPFSSLGSTVFADSAFDAALETQGMVGYDRSAVSERTVAHEVAHQWFGNSVSPARWQDIWLNEGLARYAEVLWFEAAHGRQAANAHLNRQMSSLATVTRTPNGAGVLIGDPGPDHLFSEVVYAGGALLLDDLRHRIGDDTFFQLLREWAARYRYGTATTDDFIALAEEVSGEDLDAFFADWLATPWTPQRVAARFPLAASPVP
jgi:aminopeptidase N